jgi:hypothetical protein
LKSDEALQDPPLISDTATIVVPDTINESELSNTTPVTLIPSKSPDKTLLSDQITEEKSNEGESIQ